MLSCFGSSKKDSTPSEKTPSECPFCNIPSQGDPNSSFKVVLESPEFIAFHDRSPKAKIHLLTVPRNHVGTVKDLKGNEGIALVMAMHKFGARALDIAEKHSSQQSNHPDPSSSAVPLTSRDTPFAPAEPIMSTLSERTAVDLNTQPLPAPTSKRRYGFHIPPFNSIDHLHMHCLVEPLSIIGRIKYPISGPSPHEHPPLIKGYSWFVSAQQAIDLLRAKRRIRVGAQSAYSVVGGGWATREIGGVQDASRGHTNRGRVYGTLDH